MFHGDVLVGDGIGVLSFRQREVLAVGPLLMASSLSGSAVVPVVAAAHVQDIRTSGSFDGDAAPVVYRQADCGRRSSFRYAERVGLRRHAVISRDGKGFRGVLINDGSFTGTSSGSLVRIRGIVVHGVDLRCVGMGCGTERACLGTRSGSWLRDGVEVHFWKFIPAGGGAVVCLVFGRHGCLYNV